LKNLTLFLAVFLSVLGLVGCSKESEQKEVVNVLQQIKERGKVIVGTEAAYAPFEFIEDGKIVGYGSDILAEVVKNLGVELEQLDVPFSGILTGLEEKKNDFVATSVTVTEERKEKFGLTIPIGEDKGVVLVLKDNANFRSMEDISGKTIGHNLGAAVGKELDKYNEKLKADGKPEAIKKSYTSYTEMLLDLRNGRVDGIIGSSAVINSAIKNEADKFEVIGTFGSTRYISWVTRKEDKELLDFLNAEIEKMKKSGKLAELQEKWFGTTWNLPDNI